MPSAERRAHEAKKDAEASAKRHAKGLPPVAMEELTRLRALAECWSPLVDLRIGQVASYCNLIARRQGQCHVLEG